MMLRAFSRGLLIASLAIGPLSLVAAAAVEDPGGAQFSAAVARYWEDLLRTHPLEATIFVGDHRWDDRLDDPSAGAFQAWLERLRAMQAELRAIDPAGLAPADRVDREILLTTTTGCSHSARYRSGCWIV
jgi:uncharacterized protein (DUF885 family)